MSQPSILLLNGPNLNLLGTREPEVYGSTTLEDIEQSLVKRAAQWIMLACKQSNAEHELIDAIHTARGAVGGIIFNPGAFTRTSIALRDALVGAEMPFRSPFIQRLCTRAVSASFLFVGCRAVGDFGVGNSRLRYGVKGISASPFEHGLRVGRRGDA